MEKVRGKKLRKHRERGCDIENEEAKKKGVTHFYVIIPSNADFIIWKVDIAEHYEEEGALMRDRSYSGKITVWTFVWTPKKVSWSEL